MRFLVFILLLTAAPLAQADTRVRVENIADPELRAGIHNAIGVLDTNGADRFRLQQLASSAAERAGRFLRSEGYYAARIDPRITAAESVVLHITLGRRFLVSALDYEVAHLGEFEPQVSQPILTTGDALRAQSVLDAEAAGLVWLVENGWPDAQAGERRVVVDHAEASGRVELTYDAGAYTTFGGFEPPDETWRDSFLERLNPFDEGEPVSRARLRTFEQRLEALESVNNATLTLSPAQAGSSDRDIILTLDPASRHVVEAGLSLSTSDGAGVTASWSRRNLRGGDETLALDAELATLRQGVDASLRLPHWRRLNQTLTGALGLQSEDTDAFSQNQASAEFQLTRRLSSALTAGAGARVEQALISDTAGERDITSLSLGASIVHDNRDDALDPHTGWRGTALVTPAIATGDADTTFLKWELGASGYLPVMDDVVLAGRIRIGGLAGADALDLPADDRFYAGGGGSVRGFEFQSLSPRDASGAIIGGRSLAEISAEIRWRGEGRWGAVAFADAGAAEAGTTPSFSEFDYAIGVGARYYLGFAPLRLDLAMPLSGASNDPQIYISFGQAF